jgi:hypothetical protein
MLALRRGVLAVLAIVSLILPANGLGADRLNELQTRFDHETNSVRKAKLFEQIGNEQFSDARHASQAHDYKAVAEIMERYRNNARAALNALKKEHPNAEKQLSGYKQLQIHIHKGIREVDESLLVAAEDFQPPLNLVRKDLASMDDELLVLIFPRRPEEKKTNGPMAAAPPGSTNVLDGSMTSPSVNGKPSDQPDTLPSPAQNGSAAADKETQDQPEMPPEEKPVEKSEMPDMNLKNCLVIAITACTLGANCAGSSTTPQVQQKDYLSPLESDKIRDAETTNDRIKLFLTFADDRLKKFQYELQHPSSNRHPEMLNALMNGYAGCVDDAADLMQLGVEKQENVRAGIDLMATKTKEFLEALNRLAEEKIEIETYRDNLNDAIEGTRDAMSDAEKAKKSVAPPPVRRKS